MNLQYFISLPWTDALISSVVGSLIAYLILKIIEAKHISVFLSTFFIVLLALSILIIKPNVSSNTVDYDIIKITFDNYEALLNEYKNQIAEFKQGKTDNSKAISDNAEVAFEKGLVYGRANKFELAIECFDLAIKINPSKADYYACLGHAYYYMKKYAKAIVNYTIAISKNQKYDIAYAMRGLSYIRSVEPEKAIPDYNQALTLNPKSFDYYKGRGFAYYNLKQYQQMCQDYMRACELGDCELMNSAKQEKYCQ